MKSGQTSRSYHHGDLKNALIDSAATILETRGLDELSLRGVARRAGVSRTAPYRHFADKAELLAEVIADGVYMLLADVEDAILSAGNGQNRAVAVVKSFGRFAVEQPTRYRLMFGNGDVAGNEILRAAKSALRDVLEDAFGPKRSSSVLMIALGAATMAHDDQLADRSPDWIEDDEVIAPLFESVKSKR